jgi:hypothetical protein
VVLILVVVVVAVISYLIHIYVMSCIQPPLLRPTLALPSAPSASRAAPKDTTPARACPRVVAVASTIPIHGAMVFLEMPPSAESGGRSVKQFRVCQATMSAEIQWRVVRMAVTPPQQQQPPHSAFSPSMTVPLCTRPLTAYATPYLLPKRLAHGLLPIKLRGVGGEELTLNWPFVQEGPNQASADFENNIKHIQLIKIRMSLSSILESPLLRGSNVISSLVKRDFGPYEVAVALESHRVFKFDTLTEGDDCCEISSSASSVAPRALSPAAPAASSLSLSSSLDDGDADSLLRKFSTDLGDPAMERLFRENNTAEEDGDVQHLKDMRTESSWSPPPDEERTAPAGGLTATDTNSAGGQGRSIHDILMGDDSDEEACDHEKCVDGGAIGEAMQKKEDNYAWYDDYLNHLDTEEGGREYCRGRGDQATRRGGARGSSRGEGLVSPLAVAVAEKRGRSSGDCHGEEEPQPPGGVAGARKRRRGSCSPPPPTLRSTAAAASLPPRTGTPPPALQASQAEVAEQIFLAEWEADHYFSNVSVHSRKFRVVNNDHAMADDHCGEYFKDK